MKSLILSSAVVLGALSANAAKFESCVNETSKQCGVRITWLASLSTSGTECNIIQRGDSEANGESYNQKVLFKDSNTLYSVDTDTCTSSRADISGKFEEVKQLKGRVFARTSANAGGQVYVVTRNNQIVLLTNSKGKPYKNVTDMVIDSEKETIAFAFDGGKPNQPLSLDQIFNKLNK